MKYTKTFRHILLLCAIFMFCFSEYSFAGQVCNQVVGHTTFASVSGTTGARDISDIKYEGLADESFTLRSATAYSYAGSNPLTQTGGGTYTIINNLASVTNTGGYISNQNTNTDGTFLFRPNDNNAFAEYTIRGLNATGNRTYTVEITVRNAGGLGAGNNCDWYGGMFTEMKFVSLAGNDISGGGVAGANGVRISAGDCAGNPATLGWDGNNQINGIKYGGVYKFTATFTIGQSPNNTNDNGFIIKFRVVNWNNPYDVYGIDEIKVTGCIEQQIESSSGAQICNNTPTILTAMGIGSSSDAYEWREGGATGTVIGNGRQVEVRPTAATSYWVKCIRTNQILTLTVTPVDCCGAGAAIFTIPKVCMTVNLDGYANEAFWAMAPTQKILATNSAPLSDGGHDCLTGACAGVDGTITEATPAVEWKTVYDDNYIYFYLKIFDKNPRNANNNDDWWSSDAAEIYLQNNAGHTDQYVMRWNRNANAADQKHHLVGTPGNAGTYWEGEYRIPLANYSNSITNGYFKLEVGLNQVKDGCACRAAQLYTWHAEQYYDTNNNANLHTAPTSPCVSAEATPDAVCNGGTVTLSTQMTVSGGTYTWYQGATEAAAKTSNTLITGASSTTGNPVTVTPTTTMWYAVEQNGVRSCPVKVTFNNIVATTTAAATINICAGQNITLVGNASGTTAAAQWGWKKGGNSWYSGTWVTGPSSSNADKTFSKTATTADAGTYYFVVKEGCEASSTAVTVVIDPQNTISLTSATGTNVQTICAGTAIENITYSTTGASSVTITGLPSGITYAWSVGSGSIGTLSIYGTPSSSSGGTFNYTITLVGGCGNVTATGTITVNPVPNAQITSSNGTALTCAVPSITLTASGGGTYSWNTTPAQTTAAITVTTAGTYTVTVTLNGCTSTATTTVTSDAAMPVISVAGTTSICNGTSTTLTASGANTYIWSPATGLSATTGATVTANPTTTTTYTVTGTGADPGCTGQTTVTVTVKPIYSTNDAVTICETELPYTYHNGDVFSAGGAHTIPFIATNGCDSTVTLQINVTPVTPSTATETVCKADLPFHYVDNVFGIDTMFLANTVSGDYVFTGNCTTKILTLNILEAVNSEEPQFPRVCADDGFFYIQIEPTGAAGDVPATDYTAEFSASSGIVTPQTGAVETGNKIRIDIPANIYPDIYSCKIILENPASCSSKTFENVQFEVYYPSSVMQQKWDDVIALKNSYYNGGYDFTGYQWYKDGYPTGETRSYIYLGKDTLDQNAEYYVLLTRADGSTMYSCPLKPTAAKPTVSTHPTIVANDNLITIYLTKDNATARLWTTTGILLQTAKAKAPVREISFTARQGAYLVEILNEDTGVRDVRAIVVR
jgi:hypothetical protein